VLRRAQPYRKNALALVESILAEYGKQDFAADLTSLWKIEAGAKLFRPRHRDHVVHSVLTFFLGVFLSRVLAFMVDPLQWTLAALLHDVGYPFELACELPSHLDAQLNNLRTELELDRVNLKPTVDCSSLESLMTLSGRHNSLQVITKSLEDSGVSIVLNDRVYECHGVMGSLYVLHFIDLLYSKYNQNGRDSGDASSSDFWDRAHFRLRIVPACAAIFVHNLGPDHFRSPIDRRRAAVVFLLRLAASLQEWSRPRARARRTAAADRYAFESRTGGMLVMRAPKSRCQAIRKGMKPLLASDVGIKGW